MAMKELWSFLHCRHKKSVQKLVEAGADISVHDNEGLTAVSQYADKQEMLGEVPGFPPMISPPPFVYSCTGWPVMAVQSCWSAFSTEGNTWTWR